VVKEIRTFDLSITAGSTEEETFTAEKDLIVEKILITERSGNALNNVHALITLNDEPLTRPSVPCVVFGETYNEGMPLRFSLPKGSKLKFRVTNNSSTDVTIDIALLIE